MPVAGGPKITKTGILLEVDAANASSYSSGSSTWVNVFRPGTYNGTINGTVGFNSSDSYGALTFPGTSSTYVDFGNIGDLSVSWSFQVAVKPAPSASGNYTILSYTSGSGTGSLTYKLDYSSSNQSAVLSAYSATGSTQIVHTVTGSVATGSWSIINASYGNSIMAMYVNGAPTAYQVTTGSTVGYSANNKLYLGGTYGTTSSFYTGSVASFFSYNSDVPNIQLVQNYNAYATRFGLPPSILAPITSDPDAFRFIEIAEITNSTEATAINNLVIGLKGAGLWDKMLAIYPLVGGSAYSHKWNLKTQILYNVQWLGAITHNSNGVTFTNGYGDCGVRPADTGDKNDFHFSVYTRNTGSGTFGYIGAQGRGNPYHTEMNWFGGQNYHNINNNNTTSRAVDNSIGSLLMSRTTSTSLSGYNNGVLTASPSPNSTVATTTQILLNSNGNASNINLAFATVGYGVTATDAANLHTLIQAYQTTLGRNI